MAVKSEVELLRQVPLFAAVEVAQLQLLVFNSRKRRIAVGDFLVKAGEATAAAHLLLAGEAEAIEGPGNNGKVIARLKRGAFISELGMVAGLPAAVSVRAVTPVEAMRITHELFQRVCQEFPEDGARMLASLSERLDVGLSDLLDVRSILEQARSFSRL
jgi:CRP/FNR family cyclic AMP-dependent transcriptional regulator